MGEGIETGPLDIFYFFYREFLKITRTHHRFLNQCHVIQKNTFSSQRQTSSPSQDLLSQHFPSAFNRQIFWCRLTAVEPKQHDQPIGQKIRLFYVGFLNNKTLYFSSKPTSITHGIVTHRSFNRKSPTLVRSDRFARLS